MNNKLIPASILLSAFIVLGAALYRGGLEAPNQNIFWPKWGDLGKQLVDVGAIDPNKFESVYAARGGLSKEEKELLYGGSNGRLEINEGNAGAALNLLWALGLANKNPILENGPMMDARYGGPGNFASTGGWTLARGDAMEHYSRHQLVVLNKEQQELVERVSKDIYRPCCNNSTYFPDCNHGMAMLGLLELLVADGASEEEMYRTALRANSLWFSDTYFTIAEYLKSKGVAMESVNPREILGPNFLSYTGFSRILAEFTPPEGSGGASCGV